MASDFIKTRKDKNILYTLIAILVVIVMVIVGAFVWSQTAGKETTEAISTQFDRVEMPSDSRDLTKIPEADLNAKDKNGSDNLGVDMEGRRIRVPDKLTLAPNKPGGKEQVVDRPSTEDMNQVSNIGFSFNAPTANLNDLVIGALDEVELPNGGLYVEPTNFTNMFTIRNRGIGENFTREAAEKGTLYLATHATDLGALAPGNFLVNGESKENILKEGDIVEIKDRKSGNAVLRYKITKYNTPQKDAIAADGELWKDVPRKLLLITCLPNTLNNSVFIGELI